MTISNISIGDSLKREEVIKLLKITDDHSYNNFLETPSEAVLFLKIKRSNTLEVTHLCSRRQLVWICDPINCSEDVNNFEKNIQRNKKTYLFIKNECSKNYCYLGLIDNKIVFFGKSLGLSLPNDHHEITITLKKKLTLKLWEKVGWSLDKIVYINKLQLPRKILEVIRDDSWSKFTGNQFVGVFPVKIYRLKTLLLLQKNLLKGLKYSSSELMEDRVVCLGKLQDFIIALNYNNSTVANPTVCNIYGKYNHLANDVIDFEDKMQNDQLV